MLTLYGAPPTRALRVIWLLNELGLQYEMHPVDILAGETKAEDFRALNPAAKLPVLRCDNRVIRDPAVLGGKAPRGRIHPGRDGSSCADVSVDFLSGD